MRSSFLSLSLLLALIALSAAVSIDRGFVNIEAKTGDLSDRFKVDLSSSLKQTLNLTQSSQLVLQAKVPPIPFRSRSLRMRSSLSSSRSDCAMWLSRRSPSPSWLSGTTMMSPSGQCWTSVTRYPPSHLEANKASIRRVPFGGDYQRR